MVEQAMYRARVGLPSLVCVSAVALAAAGSQPTCYTHGVTYVNDTVRKAPPNGAFVAKAKHCHGLCMRSKTCKAFTYRTHASPYGVSPVVPAGACYLFEDNTTLKKEVGSVSGPQLCPGQEPWRFPLRVSFPKTWFPPADPNAVAAEAGQGGIDNATLAARVKAALAKSRKSISEIESCRGPMCCAGSSCHSRSPCSAARGQTRCVGKSWIPFKFGTCECLSGACNRDGLCSDAPALQQQFESNSVETDLGSGTAMSGRAALVACSAVGALVLGAAVLLALVRSAAGRTPSVPAGKEALAAAEEDSAPE